MMKAIATTAVGLVMGMTLVSCGDQSAGREAVGVDVSATVPSGYALRLDRGNRDPARFLATLVPGGLQVRTGPAGILYRSDQTIDGDGTVRARFTEIDAPVGHREGFGLFVGGQDLAGSNPRYTYFLVRGDGRYLVKRRDGDATEELSNGWQPSGAVRLPTAEGEEVINELAISVERDRLRFSCNGEPVAEVPVRETAARGVVGVRVNHNLQVQILDFRVDQ